MANRIVGNVYIIDTPLQALTDGLNLKIKSVAFYSTDTTGELQIGTVANTANVLVHIRSNQAQPFTLPLYLGGVKLDNHLHINKVTAGTAWLYLE